MSRGETVAKWQVQEATTRLSELIEEADKKGPQIITRHGSEHAVVLSITDYRELTDKRENLRDYLLGGPKIDDFEVKRSRDTGRNIRLCPYEAGIYWIEMCCPRLARGGRTSGFWRSYQ